MSDSAPPPGDEDLDWLLADVEPPDPADALPVTVLTGFLGAGKTTLVNRILSEEHELRIGVIVNDFGALDVDAELILGVEARTVSVANGCVCCEVRGDLVAAVDSLARAIDGLDAIVVEASGVAEPSGIARTFVTRPFRTPVRLDAIVAVVDGEQLPAQAADTTTRDIVFGQIGYSDLVVLNKIDLADRARLDEVRAFVLDRLPSVRIVETEFADVPFEVLFGIEGGGRPHDAGPAVIASDVFEASEHTLDRPVDPDRLLAAIADLPRGVYRTKGFVHNARDPGHRYVVQAVGRRTELYREGPWGERPASTRLVTIADRHAAVRDEVGARLRATTA